MSVVMVELALLPVEALGHAVATGGACLQGGEVDYPPPFTHRPIRLMPALES